jgi:catecholate siderophore receptor
MSPASLIRFTLAALAMLLVSAAAFGQPQTTPSTGGLQGRILDPNRAPVSGARIVATSKDRSPNASTVTNENGEFIFRLEPGQYQLKVGAQGFADSTQAVDFTKPLTTPIEITLNLAGYSDTVIVTDTEGYKAETVRSATKTVTPLRDTPQSITVIQSELMRDQLMMNMGDVVRYVPGITYIQGENNRDQLVIRGQSTSADFFVDGTRDDVQYYRDLYNLDRIEALKGPNAMIFGRGGGGGVINQVTKQAGFMPLREITLEGGSFSNKRFTADFDQPINDKIALRLNGMFEDSGSFRNDVSLRRFGIAPTLTIEPTSSTKITLAYEHLSDTRVADRGITSFKGRPADVDISTYYGNPDDSHVFAYVDLGSATIEHQAGRFNIRNRTFVGGYDRGYQNYVPGAVNADKTLVTLTAYNNATARLNVFNQTDLIYSFTTGRFKHTIVGGTEFGRQLTDNFRNTGFFNNASTSILVPYADSTITTPVTYRQSATDADNHLKTNLGAAYVEDQIVFSRYFQAIAGVRYDYFDLQYHNNRNGADLRRTDNLVSPRAGLIFKPVTSVSIYGNYSVSYLPSSGDQFSSLTTITEQVKPERFDNYEVGIKWDIDRHLALTSALYRLNRTNTRSTDPNDPTRIIQTGSQRTNGFEVGLNGSITRSWQVAGGYAYQDAFISSATVSARAGAQVAQVPHQTMSLWNSYQIIPRVGVGLGILHRSDMFAGVDNTVVLPGYTRADAAVYVSLTEKMRLQVNVENLFNKTYYINADSNTNISPGFPRAVRVALNARF